MTSGIMAGKRGLIMGVANERSSAWGIAKAAADAGAELAFTYQMEGFGKRLRPLAESVGSDLMVECDVANEGAIAESFEWLSKSWSQIDFVVHALAFSDKSELKDGYMNTSRKNFNDTMLVSAFSFTETAQAARAMMPDGGALLTLSYIGAQRISPNYNVMGVAKAALESSVRYLAVDLGGQNIRVNALSAGPMKTLAGAAITGARHIYRHSEESSLLGRNPDIHEVGKSGLYLISDLSSGVTGETHFVDGGFNAVAVPPEGNSPEGK
ncbi:SDR family oxidoreductase [Alphaproteobacteria bacterium]|jgi:enoyl-[acyl-carrier protein] reductase I|nr:SDR family oxidoreductase [Alphaproteobacteria bacterium]NCF49417.1 SDR family oxidoreductase [Bacteroidota bacterium]